MRDRNENVTLRIVDGMERNQDWWDNLTDDEKDRHRAAAITGEWDRWDWLDPDPDEDGATP